MTEYFRQRKHKKSLAGRLGLGLGLGLDTIPNTL